MHWLDCYSSDRHQWQSFQQQDGTRSYYRRLGIVESFFDTDGKDFGGRADIYSLLTVNVSEMLPKDQLRQRILHAWAVMRVKHVLLGSKALYGHELPAFMEQKDSDDDRFFVIDVPNTDLQVLEKAQESLTFVEDDYATVEPMRSFDMP